MAGRVTKVGVGAGAETGAPIWVTYIEALQVRGYESWGFLGRWGVSDCIVYGLFRVRCNQYMMKKLRLLYTLLLLVT